MSARAELLADGGEAGRSEEFFRSPGFLAAEEVTHTLVVEGPRGRVAVPLLVREIPGSDLLDAVSPYGYPGGELEGEPPDEGEVDWSAVDLVSVFIRERLGPPALGGGRERSVVQVADPELPRKSRMSDRQQIRKNERRGYSLRSLRGDAAGEVERSAFVEIYEQTMRRTKADERYFFGATYFERILSSPRTRLFLCAAPGGEEVAAAAITVLSDGLLHYFLSGTADSHLGNAPSKNLLVAATEHAEALGVPLNLGGGVRPGDGLEEFKRGFANRTLPFRSHEIVCDAGAYERLSAGGPESDFFPRYRAAP